MEEQTFYNNGQFTENELNLIGWGLNDLLQQHGKTYRALVGPAHKAKVAKDISQLENLIEKIQEGS